MDNRKNRVALSIRCVTFAWCWTPKPKRSINKSISLCWKLVKLGSRSPDGMLFADRALETNNEKLRFGFDTSDVGVERVRIVKSKHPCTWGRGPWSSLPRRANANGVHVRVRSGFKTPDFFRPSTVVFPTYTYEFNNRLDAYTACFRALIHLENWSMFFRLQAKPSTNGQNGKNKRRTDRLKIYSSRRSFEYGRNWSLRSRRHTFGEPILRSLEFSVK